METAIRFRKLPSLLKCFLTAMLMVTGSDMLAGNQASRLHLLPFIIDGEGFQSRLLVTSVSDFPGHCSLELVGPALAFGYAKISCENSAIARMLLVLESDGAPVAMTNIDRAQARTAFQFPVLPRLGRLGLALSNDGAMDAACAVEVETAAGASVGGSDIDVPAQSLGFTVTIEPRPEPVTPIGDDSGGSGGSDDSGGSGGSGFGSGSPPPSQPPQPPLDPNVCRVGLVLNSANTGCTHENTFFSFTISDPHGIGVWRGTFSGAVRVGYTAGPARLQSGSFVAERASDSETWTILSI